MVDRETFDLIKRKHVSSESDRQMDPPKGVYGGHDGATAAFDHERFRLTTLTPPRHSPAAGGLSLTSSNAQRG